MSLLTNFEDASDIWDWNFNEHGIQIEFKIEGRKYRSTFLPHVAEHFKSKEQMMDELILKTGYKGKPSSVYSLITLMRY